MGFRKLRLFPITSHVSEDGYPVYGEAVKLQNTSAANELNAVELTITSITKERTLQADDKEEVKKVTMRDEGTLKVYECDKETARGMFGHREDGNGNTIETVNSPERKRYGMFFEGKTTKGTKYQKYIYDVEFGDMPQSFLTDTGDDSNTLEIPFNSKFMEINGEKIRAATVYDGNQGWVESEPETMYKEVEKVT